MPKKKKKAKPKPKKTTRAMVLVEADADEAPAPVSRALVRTADRDDPRTALALRSDADAADAELLVLMLVEESFAKSPEMDHVRVELESAADLRGAMALVKSRAGGYTCTLKPRLDEGRSTTGWVLQASRRYAP